MTKSWHGQLHYLRVLYKVKGVEFAGTRLNIQISCFKTHVLYTGATIQVPKYPDGTMHVAHGTCVTRMFKK